MTDSAYIFIMDDEPGIVLLCERLLSRAGYRVGTETDPRKAIEFFKGHPIDLLIVDIRMPGVDGFEVVEHFKKLQPESSVLIMTGHGTIEIAIRALRQGVDGLLLKPFGPGSELVDAARLAMLDNQQKRDAARIQTLRPLFSVTEALLSETRLEPLMDLILDAICNHLGCSNAACYQQSRGSRSLELVTSRGKILPDLLNLRDPMDISTGPWLINSSSDELSMVTRLADLGLGSAILVPTLRQHPGMVLFAARNSNEPDFRESDVEMFQILARQAEVAIENARLYAEQLENLRKVEESQKALLQSEKMAAAGRLSASIAHEVNNPLQSVQNCLHLASRDDLPEEKRREYLDLAKTELDRLMTTVHRMLDFYRPGVVSHEKVDLGEMLQYVLNLMNKQLSEANVKVNIDLLGRIPPIMAVSAQIQQVFINLTLNAADAMPEGGTLKITGRPVEGGVEIIFQDSGRGIPEDKQSNVFEPFFSTKDGGTGLGLTVSYNIVTAHGGTLELQPGRGTGACFRIFLPAGE